MTLKIVLVISSLLFSNSAVRAASIHQDAVMRDESFKAVIEPVRLDGLNCETQAEIESAKIVLGKNNEPIFWGTDETLSLRAATVLHHINKVREFFLANFNSDYIRQYPQVTVRLEMPNVFNETGHYMSEQVTEEYNNAFSIPASGTRKASEVEPWNPEIWFHPAKNKEVPSTAAQASQVLNNSQFKEAIYTAGIGAGVMTAAQAVATQSVGGLEIIVVGLGVVEGGTRLFGLLYKNSKSVIYSDTALIPEVVYHEYSHHMLSDTMPLDSVEVSTPIVEGYADYFAARVTDNPQLAGKMGAYSNTAGKNGKQNEKYSPAFEKNYYAQYDFVFSLLWGLREKFGPAFADAVVYNSHLMLKASSNIRLDMTSALLQAARLTPEWGFKRKIEMVDYFKERGL